MLINNLILTKEYLTCYKNSLAAVKFFLDEGGRYEISRICK